MQSSLDPMIWFLIELVHYLSFINSLLNSQSNQNLAILADSNIFISDDFFVLTP